MPSTYLHLLYSVIAACLSLFCHSSYSRRACLYWNVHQYKSFTWIWFGHSFIFSRNSHYKVAKANKKTEKSLSMMLLYILNVFDWIFMRFGYASEMPVHWAATFLQFGSFLLKMRSFSNALSSHNENAYASLGLS